MRSTIYTVLTIPVFGLLYVFTALTVLTLLLFASLNMERAVRAGINCWAQTVFLLIGKKLRISGMEHFDKNKKYVLIANHASLFDIMAIMAIHPGVSWFGHVRLMRIPVFRKLLRIINYIPVHKGSIRNTKEIVQQISEKSKGLTIAIFPEGTRTVDGNINSFYRGFVHVLRASEMELLPVTLNGFYHLKPKNRFYIKFNTKINVIIHKPIAPHEIHSKNDEEIIQTAREVIQSAYAYA
ncbi:MAG: 1-acyl-sn-glycerol-3-phosphate acyltransferase [Prolixibacteraceae bacterium]|nr:1-acyl-sn-glycerol-3-phosphate acyltransferase [Prolixibacteraceae bacterium]